jgi:hypothetical protein
MVQNGDTVAGKKIELIVKDDTSLPDVTKRLAQELVVNDKVNVLAGFGIKLIATGDGWAELQASMAIRGGAKALTVSITAPRDNSDRCNARPWRSVGAKAFTECCSPSW